MLSRKSIEQCSVQINLQLKRKSAEALGGKLSCPQEKDTHKDLLSSLKGMLLALRHSQQILAGYCAMILPAMIIFVAWLNVCRACSVTSSLIKHVQAQKISLPLLSCGGKLKILQSGVVYFSCFAIFSVYTFFTLCFFCLKNCLFKLN